MKAYNKPEFYVTEFESNHAVAACAYRIVSGTQKVNIYCLITSFITVFTEALSCNWKIDPFTSTSAATDYFSRLFQWGDDCEPTGGNGSVTVKWTDTQKENAQKEINNGWDILEGTIDLSGKATNTASSLSSYSWSTYDRDDDKKPSGGTVHAGYALDFLNAEEGKALS